ncbi:hypothetical protein OPT61_g1812 [Boeremia exigua]|uniref:Uncharacterized protein n=1 Tax=Boeremia exigua TaxID=749465 RepID=A0ACC2IP09_9PLEO|nr:hypothetical protein OPT61_g1812 [Boeremia exigua]
MAKFEPIFCEKVGDRTNGLQCCYPSEQDSPVCRRNFNNQTATIFEDDNGKHPAEYCRNVHKLYASKIGDDASIGNGVAPQRRYLACANFPNMARYLHNGILDPSISAEIEQYITNEIDDQALKNITFAVTECLTATCRNARDSTLCRHSCSGVNLLVNSTTPSVQGLDKCLDTLCTGRYNSLPFAVADVVGIGVGYLETAQRSDLTMFQVFMSYILQCILVVLLLFGLTFFGVRKDKCNPKISRHTGVTTPSNLQGRRQSTLSCAKTAEVQSSIRICEDSVYQGIQNLVVDFHKSQCFFSATIQIASLTYGIFDIDILNTFLLIPLATNSILPVVFSYILLLRYRKASLDTAVPVLTTICWLLASVVYWILYSHIIRINKHYPDDQKRYRAYQQFRFKLSALDECGGYSALSVCPGNFNLPKHDIISVSKKLRILTPILWGFSTIVLLVALEEQLRCWSSRPQPARTPSQCPGEFETQNGVQQETSVDPQD